MTVHLVVPDGIDDPRRPSGGNVYDRRLAAALGAPGRPVREHRVGVDGLARVLAGLPDAAVVLVDGLVASTTGVLVAESGRLRVAVLLHMPGSGPAEPAVLGAVAAVVTTSGWARRWVLDRLPVTPGRVHVAAPGVDPGPLVAGSASGSDLLCVGPLTPAKGYDDLLVALAEVRDLAWTCRCVGALDVAPSYAAGLRDRVRRLGLADRIELVGPLPPAGLDELRSVSDLVLAPSHRESYGMALAEGLARGLPAIATDVGGHPEALGAAGDGTLPGALVPTGDPAALAEALRAWLRDPALRERWRRAAASRSAGLGTWERTAAEVAAVLNRIAPRAVGSSEG
ncbi:glycosyltransferase family 4 protein [Nocardioides sp. LHD-245]|uniref:glycosyltransferase family 4 protein n=1 Tax=Nocardioides sp. LHD-245 TaxID=3051387 RepID=UPI0027DFF420|nr:glycosyltransferase family 4 protein [Nocardioides sp. LHD-245]